MTSQAITVVVVGDLEVGKRVSHILQEMSGCGYSTLNSPDPTAALELAKDAHAELGIIDARQCPEDVPRVAARFREDGIAVVVLIGAEMTLPADSLRDVSAVVVRGPTEKTTLPFAVRKALAEFRAAEFVGLLAGPIAHDLRSPLGVIGLAAQLLEGAETTAEIKPLTRKILNASRRLDWNVRDLAEFSGLRFSQPLDLDRQPGDLLKAIGDRLAEMRLDFPRRSLELRAQGDGTGNWDSPRVLQVLRSLIETSVRSSPATSTVLIDVDARSPADVTIAVSAQGFTLTPRVRQALRAEPAELRLGRNHDSAEMPFGLLSAFSLVKAMGGHLELDEHSFAPTMRAKLPRA